MIILLLGIFGCGSGHGQKVKSKSYGIMLKTMLSHTVDEISVKKAAEIKDEVIFVDAREKKEFEISHIKNSKWVGYDDFSEDRLEDVSKEDDIIVYCSVGYRSEKISEKLKEKGFKNVRNLYGGIFEWVNQGQPVYKGQQATDSVHAYNKKWGIWLNKGEKVYD